MNKWKLDLQLYAAKRFSHIKYAGLIAPIPVVLLKRIARVCKKLNYMILLMRAVSCYTRWKNDGQYLLFFFLSALHIWSRILGSCCGLLFRGGSFITENCLENYFELSPRRHVTTQFENLKIMPKLWLRYTPDRQFICAHWIVFQFSVFHIDKTHKRVFCLWFFN